jgi:pimeloyl-ACP methyl ester carboxylesterase
MGTESLLIYCGEVLAQRGHRILGVISAADPIRKWADEQRLGEMFCQILGTEQVGPRDDFFELGGHSLLAVRLLTRIEKEFHKPIALAELFRSPRIESLAKILRGSAEPERKELKVIVPFNEQGNGVPFYCVHSVGGEVASFRHLARILGPDQRFYGIQAPPEMANADFASSIESMARYYTEALMAFQPQGPCILGGRSAGSVIALEMAQLLKASGRAVELLVALDGAPYNTRTETSRWNPLIFGKLLANLPHWVAYDLLLDFSFPALAARVRNKLAALFKTAAGALRGNGNVPREVSSFMDTSSYSPGPNRLHERPVQRPACLHAEAV